MSRPDDTPLSITADALEHVTRLALLNREQEVCGFILGRKGVGESVIAVRNDAEHPERSFEMNHQGILEVMKEADFKRLDIVAVYHSHPNSEAIPSEIDKQVPDVDPAQLIISLKDGQPRCRAWRIDVPFVGDRRATEVMIHLSENGEAFAMDAPSLPWALTPGNQVRITYARIGDAADREIAVKITEAVTGGEPAVKLESTRKMDPKVMQVNRIKSVVVVKEAAKAQRLRHRCTLISRRIGHLMTEQRLDDVAPLVALINAAFPADLPVRIEERKS